jgi:hypothetical protein
LKNATRITAHGSPTHFHTHHKCPQPPGYQDHTFSKDCDTHSATMVQLKD